MIKTEKFYIYLILCTETKRIYVGRSSRHNRMQVHLKELLANRHPNKLMQSDFNMYGEKSFSFSVIQNGKLIFSYDPTRPYVSEVLVCGNPAADINKDSEKEWMERLRTYDPNFGYNYLDPYFMNGKRKADRRKIVSEMYAFPIDQL